MEHSRLDPHVSCQLLGSQHAQVIELVSRGVGLADGRGAEGATILVLPVRTGQVQVGEENFVRTRIQDEGHMEENGGGDETLTGKWSEVAEVEGRTVTAQRLRGNNNRSQASRRQICCHARCLSMGGKLNFKLESASTLRGSMELPRRTAPAT
eukprot:752906-Hanusia_phi.AAC.7